MSEDTTNEEATLPRIEQALSRVMDDVGAVGKEQRNQQQNYAFRGIDDLMNAVHPALARHGVTITPRVRKREVTQAGTRNGGVMTTTCLLVDYTFRGPLGDKIVARVWGEGSDVADKSTSKALSMALKYALLQTLMIPTKDMADGDRETPERETARPVPEAVRLPARDVTMMRLHEAAEIMGKTPAALTAKWRTAHSLGPWASIDDVDDRMLYDFVVSLQPYVAEALKQKQAGEPEPQPGDEPAAAEPDAPMAHGDKTDPWDEGPPVAQPPTTETETYE